MASLATKPVEQTQTKTVEQTQTNTVEQTKKVESAIVEQKSTDLSGRGEWIKSFEYGIPTTKGLFNKKATSENSVLAAAERIAYFIAAVIVGIGELFLNVLALPANLLIGTANFFHSCFEDKEVEDLTNIVEAPKPPEPPKEVVKKEDPTKSDPILPDPPTRGQQVKNGLLWANSWTVQWLLEGFGNFFLAAAHPNDPNNWWNKPKPVQKTEKLVETPPVPVVQSTTTTTTTTSTAAPAQK